MHVHNSIQKYALNDQFRFTILQTDIRLAFLDTNCKQHNEVYTIAEQNKWNDSLEKMSINKFTRHTKNS